MQAAGKVLILVLVPISTAMAILGVAIGLLLNPMWVGFEQGRSDVTGLTGYTPGQLQEVTGSILSDLVLGPPRFDVTLNGAPVLSERERSHMTDVRGAFTLVALAVVAAGAILLVLGLAARGGRPFWRAVRGGALLAIAVVAIAGSFCMIFFDQAFELMHRLFFASGTYTFDPRTDRLVQLFPDQFWFESGVALGVAIVALSAVVAVGVGRLAGPEPRVEAESAP